MASRELFRAALQADRDLVVAARLWQANDQLEAEDTDPARAELLRICSEAGFTGQAGLPELRTYVCTINGELVRDRPALDTFGPQNTTEEPGDPRHADVSFVGSAQLLLSLKLDPVWLEAQNPLVALNGKDESQYQAALREISALCA